MTYLLKNARLIDPQLDLDEVADVLIADDGTIAEVGQGIEDAGAEVRDLTGRIVVPGLMDCHVHLREPGQEYKEDVRSGTLASAYGGFTDIVSMPNTTPETDNADVVELVKKAADAAGYVHVHPSGACTKDRKGQALSEMGDMVRHEVKGTRDVHPQPSDLIATFISQHGELPEVIGSQQGYDKEKDVGVGFEWFEVFSDVVH
jgi:dihydroorotase